MQVASDAHVDGKKETLSRDPGTCERELRKLSVLGSTRGGQETAQLHAPTQRGIRGGGRGDVVQREQKKKGVQAKKEKREGKQSRFQNLVLNKKS